MDFRFMGGIHCLACTALVLLLAGCTSAAPASGPPEPASTLEAVADETGGTIVGTVVDEESVPVAAAQVAVKGVEGEAVTDETGAFTITNLPGGAYTVYAGKLGYDASAKQVNVVEGETSTVVLVVAKIAVGEAFKTTQPKSITIDVGFGWSIAGDSGHGCIYPAVTCQSVAVPGANTNFEVKEPKESPLETIVFEASWTANSGVCARTLRLRLFSPGEGTDPSATNEGHWTNDQHPRWTITNPVIMTIPRRDDGTMDAIDNATRQELNDGEPLTIKGTWIGRTFPPGRGLTNQAVDFNCFTQQKIDLWLTTFYGASAPFGWSARPDA